MTLNDVRSSLNLAHWWRIWVGRGCMTAIFFRFLLTIIWELVILVWEFYMLKSNIDVFFVTSFLCSLQFLLFHRIEYPKRCLWKNNWNFSMAQFLWYDCTFKKQCSVSVTLTFDIWRSIFFSELSTTLYVSCINLRSISLLITEK